MNALKEFLIRTMAFVRKELLETIRQPRLIALLVLGPFLILLIFGLGYTNQNPTPRTIIVVPPGSVIRDRVEEISEGLQNVNVVDILESEAEADRRLLDDNVDLVIVTPADPLEEVRNGERATIIFKHREIDPVELIFVGALERAYIRFINNEVLIEAVDRGKDEIEAARPLVDQAIDDGTRLRRDLRAGNISRAAQDLDALNDDVRMLNGAVRSGLVTFESVQALESEDSDGLTGLSRDIAQLEELLDELGLEEESDEALEQQAELVGEIVDTLFRIDEAIEEVLPLRSNIITQPFEGRLESLSGVELGPIDYFVPGTIALLLQHIAVTLAALSIVREKHGGSIEIFRAAPISAAETLLGKAISFFLLSGILATVLTLLVYFGLRIPMQGSWGGYAVVMAIHLFMSLGLGFWISTVSDTDTQAVQYAMILLLASIFFTGFFIGLERLAPAVLLVSLLLPASFATADLQEVMLRGGPPSSGDLTFAFILGAIFFLLAWRRMRRLMASV